MKNLRRRRSLSRLVLIPVGVALAMGFLMESAEADYMAHATYESTTGYGAGYDRAAYKPYAVPEVAAVLTQIFANGASQIEIGDSIVDLNLVKKLYKLRANQPAFVLATGPTQVAAEAKDILVNKAKLKGLEPSDYWSKDMDTRYAAGDVKSLAELDLLITQSMLRFADDLMNGRSEAKAIDTHIGIERRQFNEFAAVNAAIRPNNGMLQRLEALEPQHDDYKRLLSALQGLYEIQAKGGWKALSGAKTLKPGVTSPDVAILRTRLVEIGLLQYDSGSTRYDGELVEAVRRYQRNHKLVDDGILGTRGFGVLNIPIETRIMQVRSNLEKWRWMPRVLGAQHIVVDIARQELQVVEYNRPVLAMNVVVGKLMRPTPLLVDQMDKVVLNPYWHPPDNNIRNDIVPEQKKNPNYLSSHGIRLYRGDNSEVDPSTVQWSKYGMSIPPFRFRQDPGPDNSLGVVKFNLRLNGRAIYMHDTNHKELFPQNERLFSSGCIRVEKPIDLLYYVMRGSYASQLQYILAQPNVYPAQEVELPARIPVYVMYQTVSFDEQGAIRFTRDYYGQDARIVRAMTSPDNSL